MQEKRVKHIVLPLSKKQIKTIKNYLKGYKIFCDGATTFALLGQPRINSEELDVMLINDKQYDRIRDLFEKLELCIR